MRHSLDDVGSFIGMENFIFFNHIDVSRGFMKKFLLPVFLVSCVAYAQNPTESDTQDDSYAALYRDEKVSRLILLVKINEAANAVALMKELDLPVTDPQLFKDICLLFAVRSRNVAEVKRQLHKGVNPNAPLCTLQTSSVYVAVENARISYREDSALGVLRLLLAHGGNIYQEGEVGGFTPLDRAQRDNNKKVLEILLNLSAPRDAFLVEPCETENS